MPRKRTKEEDAARKREEYARRKKQIARQRSMNRASWTMPQTLRNRLTTARCSAKKRGVEFTLTLDQLMDIYDDQAGRCAVSGRVLSPRGCDTNVVSIDRITAGGPYTMDNVQLVVSKLNLFKGQMNNEELLNYAKEIVKTLSPQ